MFIKEKCMKYEKTSQRKVTYMDWKVSVTPVKMARMMGDKKLGSSCGISAYQCADQTGVL